MENFKEIAEQVLAGELSGTFINRRGDIIPSDVLHKYDCIKYPYMYWEKCITRNGNFFYNEEEISDYDIIDFISNSKKEQIKIDIPEGKIPVMESTESGVVITWKEKELTYTELSDKFRNNLECIHSSLINLSSKAFYKKVEVLRKLTNIRNYFGKGDKTKRGYYICQHVNPNDYSYKFVAMEFCIHDPHEVVFAKKEHAEQAIKMLGDELKYLFEPW